MTMAKNYNDEAQKIQAELLQSVKQCQARFGSRTELATEADAAVANLCCSIEKVFQHGLRAKPTISTSSLSFLSNLNLRQVGELVTNGLTSSLNGTNGDNATFWAFIQEHLTKHERERYNNLPKVHQDYGRGRSWLRSALNENSLERYLAIFLGDNTKLAHYYEDWAFLRNDENTSVLTSAIIGLKTVLFALSVNNQNLDKYIPPSVPDPEPKIALRSIDQPKAAMKPKRKVPTQVISFDDEEEGDAPALLKPSKSSPTIASTPSPTGSYSAHQAHSLPAKRHFPRTQARLRPSSSMDGNLAEMGQQSSPNTVLRPLDWPEDEELVPYREGISHLTSSSDSSAAEVSKAKPAIDVSNAYHAGELKELLMVVVSKKDLAEERLKALADELAALKSHESALRLTLEENEAQWQQQKQELQKRLDILNKENVLLKAQLKKYVAAMQLLNDTNNRQKLKVEESPTSPNTPSNTRDYHQEAIEYARKLVQVAEMHGELVEFNEHLQNCLRKKDSVINRLQRELEHLRGPLPRELCSADQPEADTLSVESEDNLALINIWIPSAFLARAGSDLHHVYQVYVRIRDDEWNVYRRYSQFYALQQELKKLDPVAFSFDFPPKKSFGNKDAKFVESRRRKLQVYLRSVVHAWLQTSSELASHPSKATLTKELPFFGEHFSVKKTPSKSLFQKKNSPEQTTSPLYNGV